MKKILVFLVLFFVTLILLNYKHNTVTVFYNKEYDFYTLNTNKINISNNNINNYFDTTEVILVKLRFNPIYKNKIRDTYCKLNEVKKVYKDKMNSIKLLDKYNEYKDIYFDEVRVYTTSDKINKIINEYDITLISNNS